MKVLVNSYEICYIDIYMVFIYDFEVNKILLRRKISMEQRTELETNILVSEVRSNEIGTNEYERKIDPFAFSMDAEWMRYEPVTPWQRKTKELFLDAKAKGKLHSFTCMAIDPAVVDGKLVYQKGLPSAIGYGRTTWNKLLKNYAPSRNSRQLAETEYACKNLHIIGKLVEEEKWDSSKAWYTVCDDSREIADCCRKDDEQKGAILTGGKGICGFYDLGGGFKMIAQDPWKRDLNRDPYDSWILAVPHCEWPYGVFAIAQTRGNFGSCSYTKANIVQLAMD